MRRGLPVVAGVVSWSAIVVMVTGCGGGGGSSPTAPSTSTPRPSAAIAVGAFTAVAGTATSTGTVPHQVSFELRETGGVGATISAVSFTLTFANGSTGSAQPAVTEALVASRINANGTLRSNALTLNSPAGSGAASQVAVRISFTDDSNQAGSSTGSASVTAPVATPPSTPPPPPTGPRTTFGAGQYRVGDDIVAGRYYTDPVTGCYWERQRGFGGTTSDIISNEFIDFDATQWIVDILSSDHGFETDLECRTWSMSPPHGPQPNRIPPGVWRVGDQIAPGTYTTIANSGCYWERVRNFEGTVSAIIANNFVSSAGQQVVTISSGDVGFHNDGDCGTWSRSQSQTFSATDGASSTDTIERNAAMHRRKQGLP